MKVFSSPGWIVPSLLVVPALSLSFAAEVRAQEQPSLALNRYTPVPAGDRFFGVPDAGAGDHLVPHASLIIDYAHDPLVLESVDASGETVTDAVVEHQLFAHLGVAIGLWDIFKVDVSMPVALYQAGSDPDSGQGSFQSPSSAGLGDLRLGVRGQVWAHKKGYLTLGVGGYLWVPTGSSADASFTSDGSVRALPQVNVSGQASSIVYSASTGVDIRAGQEYGGTVQGSRWQINAAAGVLFGPEDMFQVGPELNLGLTLDDVAQETTNSEVLLGGKWRLHPAWVAGLGAGTGLAGGAGTPNFRALASFAYSPEPMKDSDGDGILDREDACPLRAGVRSEDPSKNGCPASDRDHDGIIDSIDACPNDPGSVSEDSELHGCPDTDGDGIIDSVDACPALAGVENDDASKHGCPLDTDGDGIIDKEDACPELVGVASENPEENGCPPDRDGDGIIDSVDACPDLAGQASEDPQKHGCPDQDSDGILDQDDACPSEWGRENEDPKKHGCPAVEVSGEKIVILQKVQFAVRSATIESESFALLAEIARVFQAHQEIRKVEIQGHTDARGHRVMNLKLSQARAESVRMALVERGVDASRLTSKGLGPQVPIATNATVEGREKNRRVEFKILELKIEETNAGKKESR